MQHLPMVPPTPPKNVLQSDMLRLLNQPRRTSSPPKLVPAVSLYYYLHDISHDSFTTVSAARISGLFEYVIYYIFYLSNQFMAYILIMENNYGHQLWKSIMEIQSYLLGAYEPQYLWRSPYHLLLNIKRALHVLKQSLSKE